MKAPSAPHRTRKVHAFPFVLAVLAIGVSEPIRAQTGTWGDSASSVAASPDLDGWREAGLSILGTGLVLSGQLADVRFRDVPSGGYDPLGIDLSLDRSAVGEHHLGASKVSDWTRNATMALPYAVSLATNPGGERTGGLARTAVVHAETMLISQGLAAIGKKLLGRPRPYAYLPALDRPAGTAYDVEQGRTFLSMPSGHSATAWTGAAMGLTEYMLNRPVAPWWERFAVGFAGGALAGATSALRVEAGQHFPSDVIAGAGIGVAVGVTIPLLHRGGRSLPSSKSWLEMTGGVLVGTFLGSLAAETF